MVGGTGAYLQGDTTGGGAPDLLVAGFGNEVLVAGCDTLPGSTSGADVFSFISELAGQSYTITSFHGEDTLYMMNAAAANDALTHQTTSDSTFNDKWHEDHFGWRELQIDLDSVYARLRGNSSLYSTGQR